MVSQQEMNQYGGWSLSDQGVWVAACGLACGASLIPTKEVVYLMCKRPMRGLLQGQGP